jgi:hypothetical protein
MEVESKIAEVVALIQVAQESWKGWDFAHDPGRCTCHLQHERRDPALTSVGPSQDWDARKKELTDKGHADYCVDDIVDAEQSYARIVARDAKRAAEYGEKAIEYLIGKNGNLRHSAHVRRDLLLARMQLGEACAIERDYGADVTWSKPHEALRDLMQSL